MHRLALALLCLTALGCVEEEEPEPVLPGDPRFLRDPALDVENRSAHDQRRSHNPGQNCMACHQAHGPGKGRFTIGLSVIGPDGAPHANPVLELYAVPPAPGATPRFVFEGDLLGNVFSTDALPLPEPPLFAVVRSRDGSLRNQMPFPTSSGACNQCHRPGFAVRLEVVP